mmetsp:Transcript_33567/g.81164  ORF Transcript_33567/g.81164 Transcript_33567/m.81164 type:complete len:84 (-) Transcript_33567:106-357(-)
MMDNGKFRSALIASPATQHTASNPKYPKKDETAPRSTPDAPNSGGTNGTKLELLKRAKPPITMKPTRKTLIQVKKSVTIFRAV